MREPADARAVALLVTRNFPPLIGGMENVNLHLVRELSQDWQVALCGPAGCRAYVPEAISVSETAIKPLPRFLVGTAMRAAWMAFRLKPEVVIAGSGLAAPMAWLAARLSGARLAVYLHGLDVIAPSRIYQRVWLPFIRACDVVFVNSSNTGKLATGRGVRYQRMSVLHPGTDIPELKPRAGEEFRERFKFGDRPILLSVGRLTRRKGLAEFVTRALPLIVAAYPAAILVVVGEEAVDALHTQAGSERGRILAAAKAANVESNIQFVGRCDPDSLGAAYQAAQAHVFPVLEQVGDVEGFGMVALESAAHALRTVAFAVGGVPDAVSEPGTGRLVAPANYERFAGAVGELLSSPQTDAGRAIAREFAAGKDWTAFGRQLRSTLRAQP